MAALPGSRSIVVVGPSGSGKSTMINGVRGREFEDTLVIPRRVITLPVREDSNPIENENVHESVFRERVDAGAIDPWWTRRLGSEGLYYYGFEKVADQDTRTAVYLANNPLLVAENPTVRNLLARSTVVVVCATETERAGRIEERLPSITSSELTTRVADRTEGLDVLEAIALFTIDTTHQTVEDSRRQFLDIVIACSVAS